MLFKNVASQKIHVYAYDSTTGAAKTGDAANITGYVSLDGTANAIDDTNPTEVDATNMPGIYAFDLTQAETNCNSFALYAKSSTSNIRIEPIIGFTTGAANSLSVTTGVNSDKTDYALTSAYDAAKTASTQASVDVIDGIVDTIVARVVGTIAAGTHNPQSGDIYALANGATGFTAIDTVVDAIKAKTDNLPSDPADQSAVELAVTSATSPLATAANLATVAGYLDTEIAAILADTDELQKAITDGGRTDLLIDAIKAKTDNMLDSTDIATALTTAWTTTTLPEDYPADGAEATPAELLYLILSGVTQFNVSGTTLTQYKLNKTTPAATYTLDSATAPTQRLRAT